MINKIPKLILIPATLLFFVAASVAPVAQAQEWDFSGYLKNLFISGKTIFNEIFYLFTHRLREQIVFYPSPSIEFRAVIDNQLRWGNYLQSAQYALGRPLEDLSYLDLTLDPYLSGNLAWKTTVYRFYLRSTSDHVDFTAGRQRIAWGTGRLWNPTDLFNPNSPLSIEPAEKRGADAVHLALRPHQSLQLEFAWAIGTEEDDIRWGSRARQTVGSYDISIMGGRFRDSKVLGFDFTGYLGDAGIRGEFTHTWDPERKYMRAVLSLEYTFTNGINLLTEYLFNGGNINRFSPDNIERIATYDAITTINQNFLALQISRNFHPLLSGSLLGLFDIEDGGVFLFPMLSYSWNQDIDLIFGAQFFYGENGDFSYYHPTVIASMEWYF